MKILTSSSPLRLALALAALTLAALACSDDANTGLVSVTCPDGFVDQGGRCQQATPITLEPSTLGVAALGVPYVQTLTAAGGARPYAFSVGAGLPPGLTLSSGGQLGGTPTESGAFTFTVTATDSLGSSGAQTYTLRVLDPGDPNNTNNANNSTNNNTNNANNSTNNANNNPICVPADEVCGDGLDNDCDGEADEGCPVCAPTEEVCDGADNDCDGQVDEGVLNACGACGAAPEEVCDGVDNSCDGVVDEGCPCEAGQTEACGLSEGACSPGTRTCVAGAWGACEGAVTPQAEACEDGVDNDCDGMIDEECPVCVPSAEVCDGLDNDCDGEVDEGVLNACGACGAAPRELCNGADDDCDGMIDEEAEGSGLSCGEGEFLCSAGTTACVGGQVVCEGAVFGGAEVCNGEDDDCDGSTDEEASGVGELCTGSACGIGVQVCEGGALRCDADEPAPSAPGTVANLAVEDGFIRAYTGTTDPYITDQGASHSILITSDGTRIYNVALGINGQPFTGWTVRVFEPTARELRHVETFTIPASWQDEGAGFQGIVGAAADGDAIWVNNYNSPAVTGDGVWRLDLNTRTADFVYRWGGRFTGDGGSEYDWTRDVFWTIELNEPDPMVYRFPGTGLDPQAEEARFQVDLPDNNVRLGTVASNGVHLFGMPYTNEPRAVASALWRFGSGYGGTVAGGGVTSFASLPAAASMTYHRDGALYVPDQTNPQNVRRVTVTATGDEICDGLDNNCNGSVDEGACGGVDLDVVSAEATQFNPNSNEVFIQYVTFNRGDVQAPATTDSVVLRQADVNTTTTLGSVTQPAQAPQNQRTSQLVVRLPEATPSGEVELAVIADAPATTGDVRRANNTRAVRLTYRSPFECAPDRFEEDDTSAAATALDRLGFEGDLRLCGADEDWYAITVPGNATQSVFVGFQHAQGDLNVYLYLNPNGQPVLSAASDTDNEFLRWQNSRNNETTFYLQLIQSGASPRIDYTISTGNF